MQTANHEQAEFWSDQGCGAKWLAQEDRLDAAMKPVLDLVMERAGLAPGMDVLDIGCGTGSSVLSAARRVAPDGSVLGVDISGALLDCAKAKIPSELADAITLTLADAQTHAFAPESCDALISRFGVMFFVDPVAAFANMATALRPGAKVTFASWGPLRGNPWFRLPFEAAVARMGEPPRADPTAPGPLAFQDTERVTRILHEAGLVEASVDVVALAMTPQGDAADMADLVTQVGPAGRVVEHFQGDQSDMAAIRDTVRDHMQAFQTPDGIKVPATINLYQARKASRGSKS